MSHTTGELPDQNRNYDINKDYKSISSGNADEALKLIRKNLDYIKNGRYIQSNRPNYLVDSHTDTFDEAEYQKSKNKPRFRKEEWICKRCKGQVYNSVGEIIDY